MHSNFNEQTLKLFQWERSHQIYIYGLLLSNISDGLEILVGMGKVQQWKEVDQLAGCEAVAQKTDKSDAWTRKEAAKSKKYFGDGVYRIW